VGCRRTAPPAALVRVVAGPGGSLQVGRSLPGRGAWLCAGTTACLETAVRRKAFDRALRMRLGEGAVEHLRTTLVGRGRIES
jgi:predicted RNA-binding protein YlxR (DUF448 family)